MNYNVSKTIKLPADGSEVSMDISGVFFLCRTAASDFEMSFDGQSFFVMTQGEGFGPLAAPFRKLWFRSIDGLDQSVVFRASDVLNFNARLNIIHDANQILSVGSKIPATYLVPSNFVLDAAGGANDKRVIPGTNAGNQRKDIIIFNLDAAGLVTVQNALGGTGGVVYPNDNLPLETSDTIKLVNLSGAPISVLVMEVYYSA